MKIRSLAAAFALVSAAAFGQTMTDKVNVTVVNVDAVVTAPDGTPVHGLSRDDFQLFEDGVAQPITNFYAVAGLAATAAPSASTPAAAPNDDARFRRRVLLLIDNGHISKHGRDVALDRLEQFIDDTFRTGEYDWSIASIGGHLDMVMPLTSDKQHIHEVLAAIRQGAAKQATIDRLTAPENSPSVNASRVNGFVPGASEIFSRDQSDVERAMQAKFSTQAIVGAARAFAGAEGKKVILLLTDNSDFNDLELSYLTHDVTVQRDFISRDHRDDLPGIAKDLKSYKDRIVAEANASNVSFYIINPEGLKAPGDLGGSNPSDAVGATNNQAMYWLAAETGGRLMPGNDLNASIKQFESTSSNYYSLGFRPAHDDGKYHKLTVKLTKPGNYAVRYRDGYSNESSDAQIERALRSSISMAGESALPVTLKTEKAEPQTDHGAMLVPFQATIPVADLQFLPVGEKWNANLDIYVSVFDDSGKNLTFNRFTTSATATSANPDPHGTFTYRNGILMRRGENHRIVVAFRDRSTDAVGVAESMVRPE